MQPTTIALITLTNKGYLNYTFNCIKSLELLGLEGRIKCYAIGQEAFEALNLKGIETELIRDENNTEFQFYKRGNWAVITYYKLEIIHNNLQQHEFVCYTDGDIVFEDAKFLQYCIDNLGNSDILIQNDTMSDSSDRILCAGFIFIKSNPNTLKYFDPKYVKINSTVDEKWDDQIYINSVKNDLNFKLLPLNLFPNGKYYRKNHTILKPLLIHFNWAIGHEKSYHLIRYKKYKSTSLLFRFLPEAVLSAPRMKIKYLILLVIRKFKERINKRNSTQYKSSVARN